MDFFINGVKCEGKIKTIELSNKENTETFARPSIKGTVKINMPKKTKKLIYERFIKIQLSRKLMLILNKTKKIRTKKKLYKRVLKTLGLRRK